MAQQARWTAASRCCWCPTNCPRRARTTPPPISRSARRPAPATRQDAARPGCLPRTAAGPSAAPAQREQQRSAAAEGTAADHATHHRRAHAASVAAAAAGPQLAGKEEQAPAEARAAGRRRTGSCAGRHRDELYQPGHARVAAGALPGRLAAQGRAARHAQLSLRRAARSGLHGNPVIEVAHAARRRAADARASSAPAAHAEIDRRRWISCGWPARSTRFRPNWRAITACCDFAYEWQFEGGRPAPGPCCPVTSCFLRRGVAAPHTG